MDPSSITTFVQVTSSMISGLIGIAGVSIMAYGAIKSAVSFVMFTIKRDDLLSEIRIDLAKHLALGLEFLVAKDIIETIVRPSKDQLILLAGIVLIRTFIAHMLTKEVKEAAEELESEAEFEEALQHYETARESHRKNHKH